jgi:hypothetical protein
MFFSPAHMAKGNWRAAFYIDERASPAQREALSAIFSFQPGGAFAPQAGLVSEVLGVKFVPITFEAQGRQWKMAIQKGDRFPPALVSCLWPRTTS